MFFQQKAAELHAEAFNSLMSVIPFNDPGAFIILTSTRPDKASSPLPPGRFYEGQMKHN